MDSILFIQNIGVGGLVMIVIIVLLLFGGKKIPELMRGLGGGLKEFKKATHEIEEDIRTSVNTEELAKNKEENKIEISKSDKS